MSEEVQTAKGLAHAFAQAMIVNLKHNVGELRRSGAVMSVGPDTREPVEGAEKDMP